jgi:hypothetical protein
LTKILEQKVGSRIAIQRRNMRIDDNTYCAVGLPMVRNMIGNPSKKPSRILIMDRPI